MRPLRPSRRAEARQWLCAQQREPAMRGIEDPVRLPLRGQRRLARHRRCLHVLLPV